MNHLKLICCISIMYLSTSICEYLVHKYIMHHPKLQTISDHIQHHKDVNLNMTLVQDYNEDGMYFNSLSTIILIMIGFVMYYVIINKLFKYRLHNKYIGLITVIMGLLYKIIWNHLHYRFHMLHNKPYNKWNWYEKLSFKNHYMHHLQKGKRKGNYCILLLGADILFGTNNKCIDNYDYCRNMKSQLSKSEKELCNKQALNKKLPYNLQFCN
jgi:hypothetical protein